MQYVDARTARDLQGLRLALTVGVPGPWGESAKSVFEFKGVAYTPVAQYAGESNADLVAWTGIRNAPVAVNDDEPARSNFQDIVALAERLAPEPRLLPLDALERQTCFGISTEICGEGGFGWTRRITMSTRPRESRGGDESAAAAPPRLGPAMARAYRASAAQRAHAERHVAAILDSLAARLDAQRAAGSRYFVGREVSACDIHWACFSALLEPLPHAVNPMPDWLRRAYSYLGDEVARHKHPILLAHRDMMFERHLRLPLDF